MNVEELVLKYANTQGGGLVPPCIGLTPNTLPEVQKPALAEISHTGKNKLLTRKETALKVVKVSNLPCFFIFHEIEETTDLFIYDVSHLHVCSYYRNFIPMSH